MTAGKNKITVSTRKMPTGEKYNWSDAWLLFSIIYAGGGRGAASLEKIIGAGDWINHAVFNCDEFESGLARLAAGNYIKKRDRGFSVTLKVKRTYAEIAARSRFVAEELAGIERLIGAAAATSEQPQTNDLHYDGFSPEEYLAAVDNYLNPKK